MEELIEKLKCITDVSKDRRILYDVLDSIGITYKKTNCKQCLRDLYNIAMEELGMVSDASELSDFNGHGGWVYIQKKPASWKGHLIDSTTPIDVVEEFVKVHPDGWFRRITD